MPTVHINKKEFEKLVGKKLPINKLKDRISYLGTDLDSIEGNEIIVEIFPNRPDLLSEQGLARAFSTFIGVSKGLKEYKVTKSNKKLTVKNLPPQWPYVVACIVKGLKFNDEKIREVIQLQEKLGTTLTRNRKKGGLGLYPLDKITFPVSFIGMKPKDIKFRPLEFPTVITADQILVKHSKGREYGYIMDGWETYPVFVDANGIIMSMPPIINSHDVGKINETTKDVFIECTGYDLNTITVSLSILATSLADMGGKIESIQVVYPNKIFSIPDLTPKKMKIDVGYVNKILGLNLKINEVKKYLEQMGYGYSKGTAFVPAYRADVMHPSDLVEDIAIAYGYENFKEEIPNVATVGEEDKLEIFKRKVANIFVGFNLIETSTYHLTNKRDLVDNMCYKTDYADLEKASSSEYDILRTWLLPSLFQVLRANKHHEYPHRLFEIGTVFVKSKETETGIYEPSKLTVVICSKDAGFTEVKQYMDYLMDSLELEYSMKNVDHSSFISGRVGEIIVKRKKIGLVGEIHPQVLINFDLEMPAAAFEINLTELFNLL